MRVPPIWDNIKVVISDGTTARVINPRKVTVTVDRLNDMRVIELLAPGLLAALDYLEQPEVVQAPSLDSVVRGWVR